MKDKKITFLISSLNIGGAEGVCINLANQFVKNGWVIDLIVLKFSPTTLHKKLNKDINLIILNTKNARSSFFKLGQYFKNSKPNKVLIFNYELTVIIVILKKLLRLKTIIITRNINLLSFKKRDLKGIWNNLVVKPLINIFFRQSDHIINQCEAMKNDLQFVYPNISHKLSVIYNPINVELQNFSNTINFKSVNKEDYLLCVGKLEKQKAFHYAIEGFYRINKIYPTLKLKIIGSGSLEYSLKNLANHLGIYKKIDFEGSHQNLIPYYIGAKATILTSLYEGFPNVLLESIAIGVPVIAFDCQSGPNEIIIDGVNGFLVKYKDVNDLSEKIILSLKKKWDYEMISKTAHKFNIESIANIYETKIKSL